MFSARKRVFTHRADEDEAIYYIYRQEQNKTKGKSEAHTKFNHSFSHNNKKQESAYHSFIFFKSTTTVGPLKSRDCQ